MNEIMMGQIRIQFVQKDIKKQLHRFV